MHREPSAPPESTRVPFHRRFLAGMEFGDREYYRRLLPLALPIVGQQFVTSSINTGTVLMIGQLGETAVASAGLATQFVWVLNLLQFGAASGASVFAAQFWGNRDTSSIRKVLGVSLAVTMLGTALFFLAAVFIPRLILSFYTGDPAVIEAGSAYLRILAPAFPFMTLTYIFAAVLRSTGNPRVPFLASLVALMVNTAVGLSLIFGLAGLPALGLKGAAIGTVTARIVECVLLLAIVYRGRGLAAGRPAELFSFDPTFARGVLRRTLPVMFNETLWALGATTYNAIYAHIGTNAVAAVNIAAMVDTLAFVFFFGFSDAGAILVGHRIGAGETDRAFRYAARSLFIGMVGGVLFGAIILAITPAVLSLYRVSPGVIANARGIMTVIAFTLWMRVGNLNLVVGIFRAGGDTRFAAVVDVLTVWLVGVPLALIGAFVLHLPIPWVYMLVMAEEIVKLSICTVHFLSRGWIQSVVRQGQG